jgi:hypothetical protein
MCIVKFTSFFILTILLGSCTERKLMLTHGIDESAGGGSVYCEYVTAS